MVGNKEIFEKRYNPKQVEEKWYKFWEGNRYFHTEPDPKKQPYCVVIPPPNITGILHMGHALNNTVQDILIRLRRMQGYCTLWIPGTDHAGIATQNVVEKELAKQGLSRNDLGRDKFLKYVWEWEEKYGSTIIHQLKKLGASCDWERTRFTMDEGLSEAVKEAFIRLYNRGLIYQGNYIINWCPRCGTALSDEEVEYKELESSFYYIKYPITGTQGRFVTVATTRPETMLGDVAVAIHPDDKRYEFIKDRELILPIVGRRLKIIRDKAVDPEFGTGAVKVTPAHDPLDFEMGLRHNLKPVIIMTPEAKMNENAGKYKGLDRFECRKKIIKDLESDELLEKIEPHVYSVGHCYRCGTVIEPYISKQWFVHMEPLSKEAVKVVKQRKINFYPKRWEKVYLHWMDNIRDWCISRQIWWGHRIPVYYCKKCYQEPEITKVNTNYKAQKIKGIIVSKEKPEKCPECGSKDIVQDNDVLDTWFSSWLWPFSTMGWPKIAQSEEHIAKGQNHIEDLEYFYPTSTLVTAQEILFFWVARMIMAGLEFMKEIPFNDVYIHGTVRDEKGRKMSKSLGNIIDPLEIIDKYGADALRYSLISITAMGQDVFLSEEKFLMGRNFTNKIWNAARFIFSNIESLEDLPVKKYDTHDRWILSLLQTLIKEVTSALENYNFNEASSLIYDYFWHKFCDWYIEFNKLVLQANDKERVNKSKVILIYLLDNLLRLLHPFMPFITEEIWQKFRPYFSISYKCLGLKFEEADSIMKSFWPKVLEEFIDEESEEKIQLLIEVIQMIRNIKAELNIGREEKLDILVESKDKNKIDIFEKYKGEIKVLASVKDVNISQEIIEPKHSALGIVGSCKIYLLLEEILDIEKEKNRLSKKLEDYNKKLTLVEERLKNKEFMNKADENVIEKTKKRRDELLTTIAHFKSYLETL